VRLEEGEIARLAVFTGMTEVEFIQRLTRLTKDRRGLSLAEQADGACVFLEGVECAVHPVKPRQCREFPNLWNFPGFEQTCRALPRRVSAEDYARLIEAATGRKLDGIHG
jgi:hypothetical protein